VVPLEKLENEFNFRKTRSNFRQTLKEIRNKFGADAVVRGVIKSHYFTPLYSRDFDTRMTMHLTIYMIDLESLETVACYHSEGWQRAYHYQRVGNPENYYQSFRRIASDNVQGLLSLARSSGHL